MTFYTADKGVKRCTIQITVSCITWCVSLLNMLMFLFLNQAQVSWLKRDLSLGKRKLFPDLWIIPTKCFAATQFHKPRIIGYPSSFALERVLHFPAWVHWTPEGPAVEQKGREYPVSHYTSLLFPLSGRVAQGGQRGSFSAQGLQFLHW